MNEWIPVTERLPVENDRADYEEDSFDEAWAKGFNAGLNHAIEHAAYATAADVAPVVHGRWREMDKGYYVCSACNAFITVNYGYKYCPNCGADMREVDDG